MAFRDLREYLAAASDLGELKVIEGADWNLEIGCITELGAEKFGPILLFDSIKGYPRGFRVVSNFLASPRRFALSMGLPPEMPRLEMLRAWKDKTRALKPVAPREVSSGPIMENILTGNDADPEKFPAPKWHQNDGGRYIGTADMVITKDPDSDWVNVGTYRACIQSGRRLSLWILEDRDGRHIAAKYWARGKACPALVVLGCEPATWMASPVKVEPGVSELDYAGALRGEPVEVIKSELTGLPIPAHAEIVVEGEIPPLDQDSAAEGPFGEWPGYYAHTGDECVVRIKRIMYRNDPILLGNPPLLPITQRYGVPIFVVRVWEHLENTGIPGIRGVWSHCNNLLVAVSLRQQFAGHATQALIAAAGLQYGPGMDNYFVAVDEDIDPSDLNQVLWAMCTRVDPLHQVQILNSWTSGLDPRVSPERRRRGELTMGRMLIDACKPFTWRDQYPRSNRFDDAFREATWKKWQEFLSGNDR